VRPELIPSRASRPMSAWPGDAVQDDRCTGVLARPSFHDPIWRFANSSETWPMNRHISPGSEPRWRARYLARDELGYGQDALRSVGAVSNRGRQVGAEAGTESGRIALGLKHRQHERVLSVAGQQAIPHRLRAWRI